MTENASPKPTVETQGVQIKVWIPQDFYDLLRARAARFHTSVAEESRKLMQMGLSGLQGFEALNGRMIQMDRFLHQHLEPLAFIAAMDSAFAAENWQQQTWIVHERQHNGDKEKAAKPYQEYQRMLRERAAKRLQRKLRDIDEAECDTEGETS